MGFFDEHDRETEPVRQPVPEWFKPSAGTIGKPLGDSVVMLQTEECAVVLTHFVAYPTGLAWDITLRFPGYAPNRHQMAWEGPGRARYGIKCADGTAVFPYESEEWPPVTRPDGPLLIRGGGTGDDEVVTFSLWLNPLPTEPFHLVFEWKSAGIDEITAEVNIENLAEAASQAITLWPAQRS